MGGPAGSHGMRGGRGSGSPGWPMVKVTAATASQPIAPLPQPRPALLGAGPSLAGIKCHLPQEASAPPPASPRGSGHKRSE